LHDLLRDYIILNLIIELSVKNHSLYILNIISFNELSLRLIESLINLSIIVLGTVLILLILDILHRGHLVIWKDIGVILLLSYHIQILLLLEVHVDVLYMLIY
jgi:hypothetical protein